MSTGAIIAICVAAAIILLALAFLLPAARERARVRKQERELESRRDQAATQHREHAQVRERSAEEAEQRARMAQQEAERERAEANLHQERATATERGMADDQLIDDDERGRFAGTSANVDGENGGGLTSAEAGERSDYEQGRVDERGQQEGRFTRDPAQDPETTRRS